MGAAFKNRGVAHVTRAASTTDGAPKKPNIKELAASARIRVADEEVGHVQMCMSSFLPYKPLSLQPFCRSVNMSLRLTASLNGECMHLHPCLSVSTRVFLLIRLGTACSLL